MTINQTFSLKKLQLRIFFCNFALYIVCIKIKGHHLDKNLVMRKSIYISLVTLVIMVLYSLPLRSQTKTEDLGNIWIVTIDKSGSMKDGKSDSKLRSECAYVLSAIDRYDEYIDFQKDRFFIFHTGLHNQYRGGIRNSTILKNALSPDSSFTDLFIHPEGEQYRSLKNKKQLRQLISARLQQDFIYQWSFVSQIRVTALDKALCYLSEHNLNDSYLNIFILTITDDADANDQWKNDYRAIKSASRVRLEELNDLQEKLIYNGLTGRGNGELEELEEDDKLGIHVYLYKYCSKQQLFDDKYLADEISSNISLEHTGANKLLVGLNEKDYQGVSVVYWQIDTIKINGKIDAIHVPHKYFVGDTQLSLSEDISNLKVNHVDIVGRVQVQYQDSILGSHYKDIPFYIQSKYLVSQYQHKSFVWLICLISIAFICFLVFYYVILPKSVIFSVYLPDSKKVVIRHGYRFSYPSQVPLLLLTSYRHQYDYLVNNNSQISIESINGNEIRDKKILIVSRIPLNLENPVFIADVYNRYIDCSSDMSDALKYDYSQTIQSHLVERYNNQDPKYSDFTRWIFDVVNKVYPRYYYEIDPSATQSQYTIESPLRSHTLFLIDFQKAQKNVDPIAEKILMAYYSDRTYGRADAVLAVNKSDADGIAIDICLIEQKNNGVPCISNVSHIYHHLIKDGISDDKLVVVINHLKRLLHRTIGARKIVLLDKFDDVRGSNDVHHFNVSKPVYNRFIMFIEANEKSRSQLVYSPFAPYSKFVSLHPTKHAGYLYDVIIPVSNPQISKLRKLSNDVVHLNSGTLQRLEFEGNEEYPTEIILGQNKINIEVSH